MEEGMKVQHNQLFGGDSYIFQGGNSVKVVYLKVWWLIILNPAVPLPS